MSVIHRKTKAFLGEVTVYNEEKLCGLTPGSDFKNIRQRISNQLGPEILRFYRSIRNDFNTRITFDASLLLIQPPYA